MIGIDISGQMGGWMDNLFFLMCVCPRHQKIKADSPASSAFQVGDNLVSLGGHEIRSLEDIDEAILVIKVYLGNLCLPEGFFLHIYWL
jgi:hypothetical protein